MINRKKFFDEYRQNLDPNRKLDQPEVNALNIFLDFADAAWKMFTVQQWSYIFATTFHETNATFLPIKEAYWLSEDWRKKNLRYFPYYGRGYVQITWKDNYNKFSQEIGEDFVKNPDLVMLPKYAFKILIDGFKTGAFTGKKISDYINDKSKDYIGARRCINGTDKSDLIATYAATFERILTK
ncbi:MULTISPECIES: glycoside hydrolase family 19 protein [Chryseobacterium]|uniref:Chitinase class I n=1 Tax=Chryseobacterium gambrini TaxID=373672 RepID=A0A1N7LDG3_9FLAO|nr:MULTISPECIES: glycoside hydrolase family 19 protein [Chryseobacterium]SIS71905.1 Chitinase class I [Chryseobacterium gambrini]